MRAEHGSAAVVGIRILLVTAVAVSMGLRETAAVDTAKKPVHMDFAGPVVVLGEVR